MVRIAHKHPLAIRWFHWINFPILFAMIWSGILILWANDVYPTQLYQIGYRLTHSGKENETPPVWLKVPDKIYLYPVGIKAQYSGEDEPVGLPKTRTEIPTGFRLSEGMAWHFTLAWVFTLNGVGYLVFLIVSGQWRALLPRKQSWLGALSVVRHDLMFWRRIELAPPTEKYNDAQRIAYTAVGGLGMAMVVTGLAIYKPANLGWLVEMLGGYQTARFEHFIITCLFVLFFFVHVSQVIRAGFNNFRAMITGWETVPIPLETVSSEVVEETVEPIVLEEEVETHGSE